MMATLLKKVGRNVLTTELWPLSVWGGKELLDESIPYIFIYFWWSVVPTRIKIRFDIIKTILVIILLNDRPSGSACFISKGHGKLTIYILNSLLVLLFEELSVYI